MIANTIQNTPISSVDISLGLNERLDNVKDSLSVVHESYADILQATRERLTRTQSEEPEDFWTQRLKRMKNMLEMEQEMFDNIYQLKQLSKHKAEAKSIQMKAEGLVDTSNPMPVMTGIPAKYLLGMLTTDSV